MMMRISALCDNNCWRCITASLDLFSVVRRLKTRFGVMESLFTPASNDSIDDLESSWRPECVQVLSDEGRPGTAKGSFSKFGG